MQDSWDPVHYTGFGDSENPNEQAAGQLFIDELTHAWQIEHRTFLPGLMCEAVTSQSTTLGGDMSVYEYGSPGLDFSEFNPEQQGSIVDEWFAGSGNQGPGKEGTGKQEGFDPCQENDRNPYFRYIRDNIRTRIT